jgi:hypothetical protein
LIGPSAFGFAYDLSRVCTLSFLTGAGADIIAGFIGAVASSKATDRSNGSTRG